MKLKREDLLRSKEYWMVKIQSDLYAALENYLKTNKITRTSLAQKLKVTKSYITQVLKGDFDHKISKFVDLSLASGKAPIVHFVDIEKYIKDDAQGKINTYNPNFKPVIYKTTIIKKDNNYDFIFPSSSLTLFDTLEKSTVNSETRSTISASKGQTFDRRKLMLSNDYE